MQNHIYKISNLNKFYLMWLTMSDFVLTFTNRNIQEGGNEVLSLDNNDKWTVQWISYVTIDYRSVRRDSLLLLDKRTKKKHDSSNFLPFQQGDFSNRIES